MKKPYNLNTNSRRFSRIDKLLIEIDRGLRVLTHNIQAGRKSPADIHNEMELNQQERKHIAGLMRVNHTGEVCAQALYQGQALTAKLPNVKTEMEQAAREEEDHLVWCEQRLQQLGSNTSMLNPLWYGGSFLLGAAAGAIGDSWSLGFVAATEERVCEHLQTHLEEIPSQDKKSRSILEQMLTDEKAHCDKAVKAGGLHFPKPIKKLMVVTSKLMTKSSYHI